MKKINVLKTSKGLILGLAILFTANEAYSQAEVQLVKFTADCHGDYSYVNWSTDYEINAEYFSIERSEDQINWTLVTTIQAENVYGSLTEYQATDNIPSVTGTNYYRLTVVDYNGINVVLSDEGKCGIQSDPTDPSDPTNPGVVSPNPTTGKVNVVTPITGTIDVFMLTDRTGHVVKKGIRNSRDFQIDMEGLDQGLYLLFVGDNAPLRIWKQ